MRRLLSTLFFLLLIAEVNAQDIIWAKKIGGTGDVYPFKSITDSENSIYLIGNYTYRISQDGITYDSKKNTQDIFVAKFNENGTLSWLKSFGGRGVDDVMGIGLSPDENRLYIAGFFQYACYYSATDSIEVTGTKSTTNDDAFIGVLDPDNGAVFSFNKVAWDNESTPTSQKIRGLKVTPDDKLVIFGHFTTSIVFNNSSLSDATAKLQNYICKIDPTNWSTIWLKQLVGTGTNPQHTNISSLDISSTGYYFSGNYRDNLQFDSWSIVSTSGTPDIFVIKTDTNGNGLFLKRVSGSGSEICTSTSVDESDNVYIGGYYNTTSGGINVDSVGTVASPIYSTIHPNSNGLFDLFFAKYTLLASNGTLQWFNTGGSTKTDGIYRATSKNGLFIVAGQYGAAFSFKGNPISFAGGTYDALGLVYDNTDNLVYIINIGGTGNENGRTASIDDDGNYIIIGDYTSNPLLIGSTSLSNSGSRDVFIVKYRKGSLDVASTNISCHGGADGSISVTPRGPLTPKFTYTWQKDGVEIFPEDSTYLTGLSAGEYTVTFVDAEGFTIHDTITLTDPPALSVSVADETMVGCYGEATGSVTLSAAGGTPAYKYNKNGGAWVDGVTFSNLLKGIYTFGVKDANGCTATVKDTITEPASALSLYLTGTPDTGSGNGTATANPSGGTEPYTYSWNDPLNQTTKTATGLTEGTYIGTVTDDNGCDMSCSIGIARIVVSVSAKTHVTCNGYNNGTVTISVDGGTPDYAYIISRSGTPLDTITTSDTSCVFSNLTPSNNYSVRVIDNDANESTTNFTITEPAVLSVSLQKNDITCVGYTNGSVESTVTGGTTPYSYSWTKNTEAFATTADISGLGLGTYELTVTDVNGCQNVESVTLSDTQSHLNVTTTPTNAKCASGQGSISGSITSSVSGAYGSYTYKWNTGETTSSITKNPGTYTLIVTDALGCKDTSISTINYGPRIDGSITLVAKPCTGLSNGSLTFTPSESGNGGLTYLWSNGNNNQTATSLASGNYSVTVNDVKGCQFQSSTYNLTPYALPTASVSGSTTICKGESTTITIELTGDSPWDFTYYDGSTYTTVNGRNTSPYTFSVSPSETRTYSVTAVNDSHCNGTDFGSTATVTVNPLPEPTFTAEVTSTCEGSTGNVYTTQPAMSSYVWNVSAGGTITSGGGSADNSVTVTWNTAGSRSVSVSYTNPTTGCTAASPTYSYVTVNPLPEVKAGSNSPKCTGETLNLTESGGDATAWSWTGPSGFASTLQNPSLGGVTTASSGTYTVMGTITATGCQASDNVGVTIHPLPEPTFTSEVTTACEGSTGNVYVTQSGKNTYLWSVSAGGTITAGGGITDNSVTVTWNNDGAQTVSVCYADPVTGCTAASPAVSNVTVNPLPTVTANATDTELCAGETVTLTGSGANTYTWDNGVTNGVAFIPTVTKTYTVTGTNTTTGCQNTDDITITVNPLPTVVTHNPNAVCEPNTVNLTAASVTEGSTSGLTYTYWTDANATNAYSTPATASAGSYYIKGTIPATGCFDIGDPVLVTVNPLPNVTAIASDNELCIGESVTLTGGGNANTYTWDNGVTNGISFIPTETKTYTVTGTITATGCQKTDAVLVSVYQLPTVTANASFTQICEGDGVTLWGSGASTYEWDKGVVDSEEFYPTATQTYTVTGTDSHGCKDGDQIQVKVNPYPDVQIATTDPLEYCAGVTISTKFTATPSGAQFYQWLKGGKNISGAHTSSYTATEPGAYSVIVIANGCTSVSDEVVLKVNPLPDVTLGSFSAVCIDADPVTLSGGNPLNGVFSGPGVSDGKFYPDLAGAGNHTITYTYTNDKGCTNFATSSILVNDLPEVTLAAFDPVCKNDPSFNLTGGNHPEGIYTIGGIAVTTFDPSAASVGDHSVIFSYTDGNGCSNADTSVITVKPLPEAVIATTDKTAWCEGETINTTFTASPVGTYQWFRNGAIEEGSTGQTYIANAAGEYSVEVTVNGCKASSASTTINVIPLPEISIATTDAIEWCEGEAISVLLNANPSDAEAYRWYKDDVEIDGATSSTFSANSTGTYRVEAAVNGCFNSSNGITISTKPLPNTTITTIDKTSWCEGESIMVRLAAEPASAEAYQWYLNGEAVVDSIGQTFTSVAAGSYSVEVTKNGCKATSEATTITVNELPIATITTSDKTTWCANEQIITHLIASQADTYQWYLNGEAVVDSIGQTFTAVAAGSYSVEVTKNGCKALSEPTVVTVNELPVVTIATNDKTIWCANDNIKTLFMAEPANAESYQWYMNGQLVADSTAKSFTAVAEGFYNVEVTLNGCKAFANDVVLVAKPVPTISLHTNDPTAWCQGEPISTLFTTESGNVDTYTWYKDLVLLDGETLSSFTATAVGRYHVIASLDGCSASSDTIDITAIETPVASIVTPDPLEWCEGATIDVNLTAQPDGAEQYQWMLNGVDIPEATQNSFKASSVGQYAVKATFGGGCSAISEPVAITTKALPVATLSTPDLTTWCEGSTFTVNLSTDITNAEAYQWLQNGIDLDGAISGTFAATQAGKYAVKVTVNGCTATSNEIEVTVTSSPVTSVTTNDPTVWCEGQAISVLLNAEPEGIGYQWLLNEQPINGATGRSYEATEAGSYKVIVTAGGGCQGTSEATVVSTTASPLATFTTPDQLSWCSNEAISVTFTAEQAGAESYQWLRNGSNIEGATSRVFKATEAGAYSLIVTLGGGCSATSEVVSISSIEVPAITISTNNPTTWCEGSTIDVIFSTDASNADHYQWFRDGQPITGATDKTLSITEIGSYYLESTFGSCLSVSNVMSVTTITTAVASISTSDPLKWCEGAAISSLLNANPVGAEAYQWYLNGVEIDGATLQTYTAVSTGTYTVKVTSGGGCSAISAELEISTKPLPTATIASTDPLAWCEGESISAVITCDNTNADLYQWYLDGNAIDGANTSTLTAVATGQYTLEVTANGCAGLSNAIVVSTKPLPVASIATNDPTAWCEGASISVALNAEPAGAEAYQWYRNEVAITGAIANTYNANQAGDFTVKVTVNGCSSISGKTTISAITSPVATIATTDAITWCSNQANPVTLRAIPTGAQQYQWIKDAANIDGATGDTYVASEAGVYRVLITLAGGCSDESDDITLTEHASPVVDLATDTVYIDTQKSHTFDAGTGFASYLWNDNSTQQTLTADGATLGVGVFVYWVEVTNEHGCTTRDSAVVKIKLWDNIETDNGWTLTLYPNPTTGKFYLNVSGIKSNRVTLSIYNSAGYLVSRKNINVNGGEIREEPDLSRETSGFYLIRIHDAKGSSITRRVIVE